MGTVRIKKKKERKKQDRNRVFFDLGLTQKQALEIIKNDQGLELTSLCRYAVTLLIHHYTAGKFDRREALKHKTFAGRKKKSLIEGKTENV